MVTASIASDDDLRLPLVAGEKLPLLAKDLPPSPALGGGSTWGAVCNYSTSIIGAGIMSMPAAFRVLGVVPALLLTFAVAALCFASVQFLLRYTRSAAAEAGGGSTKISYAGVVRRSFPRWGPRAVQLCVVLTNIAALVVYLIIIGDVLCGSKSRDGTAHSGILQEWFGGERWWNSRPVALLAIVLSLFSLTFRKRVDSLVVSSLVSSILALAFVAVTVYMAVTAYLAGETKPVRPYTPVTDLHSALEVIKTFPVIALAFTFHFNLHPVHNEMADPSNTPKAVLIALAVCAVVYSSVGWSGYALFGDATMGDVLANFDRSSGISPFLNNAIRLCYAAHLVLVYPVLFFSFRINADGLLFPKAQPIASHLPRFVAVTVALAIGTYLASIAIPNIWFFFELFGSTTSICLCLGFPAALVLMDVHGVSGTRAKMLAGFMIFLAAVTFLSVISSFFWS